VGVYFWGVGLGCLFAYLLGSISTGFLVARSSGINIRDTGSGNIGAANVARIMGKTAGVVTLLGDVTKGLIPVLIARMLNADPWVMALLALSAFLGHLWPLFLRFSGGKGVATTLGGLIGMTPKAVVGIGLLFVVIFLAFRFVSLASIITAMAVPVLLWQQGYARVYVIVTGVMGILIVCKHRDNIRRLINGTEPKFRLKHD
jgi:glycerol-3-phosphate acyltransferase PlsY